MELGEGDAYPGKRLPRTDPLYLQHLTPPAPAALSCYLRVSPDPRESGERMILDERKD